MHCKFVHTNVALLSFYMLTRAGRVHAQLHTYAHSRNVPGSHCKPFLVASVFSLLLVECTLSEGMLVDQCVSEAVICLAAVLLWVGRWGGYPYPPSGQPGIDKMRSWPNAERDQGITVFPAIPAAQLFLWTCQIMSVPM